MLLYGRISVVSAGVLTSQCFKWTLSVVSLASLISESKYTVVSHLWFYTSFLRHECGRSWM